MGTTDITGTRQQFWPDDTIFTETVYNYDILATRMRELAYLNAGIKISLTDLRVKDEEGNVSRNLPHVQIRGRTASHPLLGRSVIVDNQKSP